MISPIKHWSGDNANSESWLPQMTAGICADGVFMGVPNDPVILLSYINTMLRDSYDSLEELCKSLSVDEKQLSEKLASIGYNYDAEQKRFR